MPYNDQIIHNPKQSTLASTTPGAASKVSPATIFYHILALAPLLTTGQCIQCS